MFAMLHSLFRLTRALIAAIGCNMDEVHTSRSAPGTAPEDALDAQVGYNLKRASTFALNDFAVELAEAELRPVTYLSLIHI